MSNKKAKILIVEDEGIIANDLKVSLVALGYDVVSAASSGRSAINLAKKFSPELVIMDIELKGDMDGIDAASFINSKYDIPIIFLTAHSEENILEKAKNANPFAYILKPFDEKGLRSTIEVALHKIRQEKKSIADNKSTSLSSRVKSNIRDFGLTPREEEVCVLVVDGLNTEQIADRLYISSHTVMGHLKSVFRKLDVSSRVQMIARLSQ